MRWYGTSLMEHKLFVFGLLYNYVYTSKWHHFLVSSSTTPALARSKRQLELELAFQPEPS
jgi:hypothetical protein